MNIYKLPVDAYNRTHEQTISEDAIKDKLVGQIAIIYSQQKSKFSQGFSQGK